MSNLTKIYAICMLGIFGTILAAGAALKYMPGPVNALIDDGAYFVSGPCVQITRANGVKEPMVCNHNIVTHTGLNITRDILMGTYNGPVNYLELSTDSSAAIADTTTACPSPITDDGLAISQCSDTTIVEPVGNYSCYKQWQATGDGQNGIYKVCLGNTSSSTMTNKLFAIAWLNSTPAGIINLAAGDTLSVYYYIAADNS